MVNWEVAILHYNCTIEYFVALADYVTILEEDDYAIDTILVAINDYNFNMAAIQYCHSAIDNNIHCVRFISAFYCLIIYPYFSRSYIFSLFMADHYINPPYFIGGGPFRSNQHFFQNYISNLFDFEDCQVADCVLDDDSSDDNLDVNMVSGYHQLTDCNSYVSMHS